MMAEQEVEIIDNLIEKIRPENCLEWGSGNSTYYFPRKHRFIKLWFSVDDDENYLNYIEGDLLENTRITLAKDKESYLDCVKERKYDFILIDGSYRMDCLKMAFKVLNKDGVILLHDSGRVKYDFSQYKHEILYEGERPVKNGFLHRGLALFKGEK